MYQGKLQNFLQPIWINIYTMVQVELNNMYINISTINGREKLRTKKHSGKLIIADMLGTFMFIFFVHVSQVG